jgi:cellulose synthase (UDP-forming)
MKNWKPRLAGVLLLLTTAWYLPWMFANLNWAAPWLSLPFAIASITTAVMAFITTINHWHSDVPEKRPVPTGEEPEVAIIIPTYGEHPAMLYETTKSVLEQNYPREKIRLIISDDGHRATIREVRSRLAQEYPEAFVAYNDPPRRGDSERRGEAKAGNLNSVFDIINERAPRIQFIETRDADDKVGDPDFLRQAVGLLVADPKLAFVQTIKEAEVSPGDPFGNLEPLFYRNVMVARNAANAVFPCGSGLVWRREALADIDGFPAWNLVEDLQSGVEALRRGWHGAYLPIVGAMGQTAPEDIPNMIKQRGTWALDTMRLFFWGNRDGLGLRQKLQFAELGFFYLLSFAVLVFAATPVFALAFDIYPLITTHAEYAFRFWPFAVAVELLLLSLADGLPYEALWRARQTWLGMAPVYARATFIALRYGPNRKPSYRVTRKEHVYAWYWRETLPQTVLLVALVVASAYHIATHSMLTETDLGSLFWAAFFGLALSRVVLNAWHGLHPAKAIAKWLRRPLGTARTKVAPTTVEIDE